MAELQEGGDVHSGRGKKRGGVRAKKISTRIDMTPMVDLGFLLVTFFILTTSMIEPKAMQVVMPEKGKPTSVAASEAMTVILGNEGKICYYFGGEENADMKITDFSKIRKIIVEKNKEVTVLQKQKHKKETGVYVGVKPSDASHYENLVNILDELQIAGIKSYAITDLTSEEKNNLPQSFNN